MISANVPRVRTALQRSPNQSRLGQEAGCCRATVNRIARVRLWALPQNVFIHQILTESYKTARQHFCTSFIRKLEQKYDLVKELRYSDKTHFHVDSKSKSQKFGFWPHGKLRFGSRSTTLLSQTHASWSLSSKNRHRALLPRRRQRWHADRQCSAVPEGAGKISEGPLGSYFSTPFSEIAPSKNVMSGR